MENLIIGDKDGVVVKKKLISGEYQVSFEFDRQLSKMLREVEGVEFDEKGNAFNIPPTSLEALNKVIPAMRQEFKSIRADLESIMQLAHQSALAVQRDKAATTVQPMISNFREVDKFYAGEIVNANARYIAQLTGFGKEDGASFISMHRLADLNRSNLMKGDRVGIKYNDKFQGSVSDLSKSKSAADLAAEFEKNSGKSIDGVKTSLSQSGEHIQIAFDMNPVLLARIKRVDGAKFDQEATVWEIPIANKEFALRAVHEMREEFLLDDKEYESMQEIAASKIDSAKVSRAFSKDGMEFFGKIVAVGERYALQKGGQDYFTLHHLATLKDTPQRDQNLSIKYNKGVGVIVDLDKQKEQNKALGIVGVGR